MEPLTNRTEYRNAMMPDGIAVVEGVTATCPNCKAIAPVIEKLQKKYPEARWYQYDVDTAEDIAQELGARLVPNFSIFKDGMIVDGITGAKAKELEKAIQENYEGKIQEE